MAPSSKELSWDVLAGLLGTTIAQNMWKPTKRSKQPSGYCTTITCFDNLMLHTEYVDEMYDVSSKLPLLSMLLVDALRSYPSKNSIILPQARLIKGIEYRTDYAVCLAEKLSPTVSVC